MLGWAFAIVVIIALASAPFFLGLFVALPCWATPRGGFIDGSLRRSEAAVSPRPQIPYKALMSERQRIDQLLVTTGRFDSRARARAAIEAGLVRVGGRVVRNRPRLSRLTRPSRRRPRIRGCRAQG